MAHEEVIEIREDAPGAAPGIGFGDILKYWGLIEKLISIVQGLSMEPGEEKELGWTRLKIGGRRYRWDLGSVKRES